MNLARYRKAVWMLLHNSESSENETAAVQLYLDESGGLDPGTPHAVVGGILINYSDFLLFEKAWDRMLLSHGIVAPLHMKEFGKHRKWGAMSEHCRRELFHEVAALINSHKIATIVAKITNKEYETCLPREARDNYSVYASCFVLAAMMNKALAQKANYDGRIPFILDYGNPYAEHVRQAHKSLLDWQRKGTIHHIGGLFFDDDALFGVLQASDVIAWTARRRESGNHFPRGFEPLLGILDPSSGHNESPFSLDMLREWGAGLVRALEQEKAKLKEHHEQEDF